jgi:hypothetical protein
MCNRHKSRLFLEQPRQDDMAGIVRANSRLSPLAQGGFIPHERSADVTQGTFLFGDRTIHFLPGQTIAAAIMAAGELSLRESETGQPRGVLCCIGVCWECRCVVNERPNTRACVTLAEPGMTVRLQKGLG